MKLRIKTDKIMDDKGIIEHMKTNSRCQGQPMMDEQTFLEGAKWYRDNVVKKSNDIQPVIVPKGTVLPTTEPCSKCGKQCTGRSCNDCQRYW